MVCAVDVYTIYSVVFCTCDAPPPKKVGRAPPAAARPGAPPARRAPRSRLYAPARRASRVSRRRASALRLSMELCGSGAARARLFSLRTLYI